MRQTKVRSAALGIALLAAGLMAELMSAQALGQVPIPTVSLPTVTVPTPTVPLPPTPAPTPPPPAPVPTPSPVPLPLPSPSPSPVPSTPASPAPVLSSPASSPTGTPEGGAPPPVGVPSTGGVSSETYTASWRRQPSRRSGSQSRARVTRLRASPQRISAGSKRRGARITFRLTAPARVVFVVRGPAPSCEVIGRFSVRGHAGVNRVRFKGRVGRRTFEPGTYTLTAHPRGRAQPTHRVVVMIGTQPREGFDCGAAGAFTFAAAMPFIAAVGGGAPREGGTPKQQASTRNDESSRGVLPAIRSKLRAIPEALPRPLIPGDAADSPPMILGLLALGLLALSAIAILAYVIRFLREPHTKSA